MSDKVPFSDDDICTCGGMGPVPGSAIEKVVAQTEGRKSCCEVCPECGLRIKTECITFHRAMHAKEGAPKKGKHRK
jgi:hypothetical protein